MTLSEQAGGGRLHGLEALRDRLAVDLDECRSLRDEAALGRLFMDVLKQIDELSPAAPIKETGLSEFEKRLRERESGAKGSRSTSSG